jgi:hypothetical protein
MSSVSFEAVDGGLALRSPFNPDLVAALKALPYADRKWDAASKRWIIAQSHAERIAQLCGDLFGTRPAIPETTSHIAVPNISLVELDYLGATKQRDDGTRTATGSVNGQWSLVFPESVLRDWFQDPEPNPQVWTPQGSLYAVLAVPPTVDQEAIKAAYRKLARQWHPDVCREIDAKERFQKLAHAYEILSNPTDRHKYDVGLKLEGSLPRGKPKPYVPNPYGYRSPLRCGLVMVEGTKRVGQTHVSKILQWQDLTDAQGRVLVTSWPVGADTFQKEWIQP